MSQSLNRHSSPSTSPNSIPPICVASVDQTGYRLCRFASMWRNRALSDSLHCMRLSQPARFSMPLRGVDMGYAHGPLLTKSLATLGVVFLAGILTVSVNKMFADRIGSDP